MSPVISTAKLLLQFGMKPLFDGVNFFYCVGGRTAIGVEPFDPALGSKQFNLQAIDFER